MDSKKILAKYVKPSGVLTVIGLLFAVAAVVMLLMGIISAGNAADSMGEPVAFHALDSKENSRKNGIKPTGRGFPSRYITVLPAHRPCKGR